MANRLRTATSPYLLQHADNPVDWWPWGPEAFEEARRRDVPVLLSVGYAACHWCHVMAHQSFEDETVAAEVNASLIAIKVDREERPDVDAVYMHATQAMTGRGGWPMTCFLTPDGRPFHAGTYYPRDTFRQLVAGVAQAWAQDREKVLANGAYLAEQLAQYAEPPAPVGLDAPALADAVTRIAASYDAVHGGFGGAPKFPPSMVLEWLLRHHARTGRADALSMVDGTCEAMARGGMYDQLAGGFARYSVDRRWVVPHFEKMLYDNAQLLGVYLHWWRATGTPLGQRIARETAEFLLRDLGTAQGAFASALDADAAGQEGSTYVWTPAELVEVLAETGGERAAELLTVTPDGTFEHGASTLQLRREPEPGEEADFWADARQRLLDARATRVQPDRDDKVVTSWNGLALGALADAGALLAEPRYVEAARRCAAYLLDTHLISGRLRRVSRDGTVGTAPGTADDYGNLAAGLVTLHQATGEVRWFEAAGVLLEVALTQFGAEDGGFYDTAADTPDDAGALYLRPRGVSDNAEPSGQSALAGALLGYGALAGSDRHLEAARRALAASGGIATREPRFAGWALAAAEALAAGPLQVAIVEPTPGSGAALLDVARAASSPGLVAIAAAPDSPGIPLLADRPLIDGQAAAYVCRGFVCDAPVTAPDELVAVLARP